MQLLLLYLTTSEEMRLSKLFHLVLIFSLSGSGSSPSRKGENCFWVPLCPPLLYVLFQFYVILRLS